MANEDYGVDDLVEAYVALRDEKRALEQSLAEQIKELDTQLDIISSALNDMCKELGADAIRTSYGTVIRSVKTKYWTNDWSSIYSFIKEHDAFELLEKRIHQSNMKMFLEENQDVHPMGLNMDKEYAITIRKK